MGPGFGGGNALLRDIDIVMKGELGRTASTVLPEPKAPKRLPGTVSSIGRCCAPPQRTEDWLGGLRWLWQDGLNELFDACSSEDRDERRNPLCTGDFLV